MLGLSQVCLQSPWREPQGSRRQVVVGGPQQGGGLGWDKLGILPSVQNLRGGQKHSVIKTKDTLMHL